ncbi:hypothetical protein [Sporomusa sp.]|uniref:hypothetical protein n=1 Tax=Sporomusa sp. TaxID=2078658 RepID=UPI002B5CECFA|nr:hypothetical protein [Sporomusa sp.]HWR45554.1 hypothetical protein [Sporomusa sp.]
MDIYRIIPQFESEGLCYGISSFGKTFSISSPSDNEKVELDVPTNYHLRMNIALQNNGSTLQSVAYISKNPIKQSNAIFTIVLKAPEPQPVSIASDDFEISRP